MRHVHKLTHEESRRGILRRNQVKVGGRRAGGCAFFTVVILCCLSCSRDAAQPQLGPGRSSGEDVTSSSETEDGSSTREGSASKRTQQPGSPRASKDSNANSAASITTSTAKEWVDNMRRDMDPSKDGWDTEFFAERAGKQLNRLGKILLRDDPTTSDEFAELVASDFSCTPLRPADLEKVFADGSVTVMRPRRYVENALHHGAIAFIGALEELAVGLDGASDKHFKFKLFRVTPLDRQIETTSYLELSGRIASGTVQRLTTWRCRWEPGTSVHEPRLLSIIVDDYEEVEIQNTNQTLFSDCTESIFRDSIVYDEQFRLGIDHWRARLENYLGIFYDGHRGVALGDVNGDGLDDVYLCEPGGLPNRLFIQSPVGLLKDVSTRSGVDLLDSTRCALFVDLDNDGDQDLVMPVERQIQFFSNDGTGRFTRKAKLAIKGQTAFSLAAADYDQDGNIDVYACFLPWPGR